MPQKYVERITHIKGVFTNGDPEDQAPEFASVLKNLRPQNGKLVKTHGFGDKLSLDDANILDVIDNASTEWDDVENWEDEGFWVDATITETLSLNTYESVCGLIVYHHPKLNFHAASGDEYIIIAYIINESTGAVTLKCWVDGEWKAITELTVNSFPGFYHKFGNNPVILSDDVLRILPGDVAAMYGSDAEGIWVGYIDRDYCDGVVEAGTEDQVDDGVKDYEKGFYCYPTTIDTPDLGASGLDVAHSIFEGGSFDPDGELTSYYYKFSAVYDGVQESPLSEAYPIEYIDKQFAMIYFKVLTLPSLTNHNARITQYRIYRSTSLEGTYNRIHTIDLTREESGRLSGGGSSTAYCGRRYMYVPELASHNFNIGSAYAIKMWDTHGDGTSNITRAIKLATYSGTGNVIFEVESVTYRASASELDDIAGHYHNVRWELFYWNVSAWVTQNKSGSFGLYAGYRTAIFPSEDFDEDALVGSVFYSSYDEEYHEIMSNTDKALQIGEGAEYVTNWSTSSWWIQRIVDGLYNFEDMTTYFRVRFFDTFLDAQEEFPYGSEEHIHANSEFAMMLHGRLLQANAIVDPYGEAEERQHAILFSQAGQPDVTPITNEIDLADAVGRITGVAQSFGSAVITTAMNIFRIKAEDPSDPTTWSIREPIFNRGNVAKKGLVQDGHVIYICAFDGIYRYDINLDAAADETPLIQNRISEPINDQYLALNDITEKPAIVAGYDPSTTEIIYQFKEGDVWAYNTLTHQWRQIESDVNLDLAITGHDGYVMVFDHDTNKIYSTSHKESVVVNFTTRRFFVSDNRREVVRRAKVRYKSGSALAVNLYTDDEDTVKVEKTIAASSTVTTKKATFRKRAESFRLEIKESAASTNDIEINDVKVEHDV